MARTESNISEQTAISGSVTGQHGAGYIYAISAYLMWGFLPIYFVALAPTGPFEIVAWRIVLSLVFCAILLMITRTWRKLIELLRDKRVIWTMAAAGALIYINWQVFVYATATGQVVDSALGYFINPIVTVFLGVLVLRERLSRLQWVAVAISILAVLGLTVSRGTVPWISLALAFSFGFYGLIKKRVGNKVDALSGLTLETVWIVPVALIQLWVVAASTGLTFGSNGAWHTGLLSLAGVMTAIPLLLFAAGSRRLPLTHIGFIQYFSPFIQFLVAVVILREPMPIERWIGFGLVWLALLVLTIDLIRRARRAGRSADPNEPPLITGSWEPV